MTTTTTLLVALTILMVCGCQGPQGEAGPPGGQGKPGPAGPAGTAGLDRAGERIVPLSVLANDGAAAHLGWWDTDRDEECFWVRMSPSDPMEIDPETATTYTRATCLPLRGYERISSTSLYRYYSDPECEQPISWLPELSKKVVIEFRMKSLWYWSETKAEAGQLYEWNDGVCEPAVEQCDATHCYAMTSAEEDFASASGPLAH